MPTARDPDRRQHAAEGNDGKNRQGGGQDHDRRQDEQKLVDVGRRVLFLEDELQTVGQRLQQSQRPDAVGPQPILHPSGDPALEQHQIGRRRHQRTDQDRDLDQRQNTGAIRWNQLCQT